VIGDEGAIRIAEGLEKNTSLKILNLKCVFFPLLVSLFPLFLVVSRVHGKVDRGSHICVINFE